MNVFGITTLLQGSLAFVCLARVFSSLVVSFADRHGYVLCSSIFGAAPPGILGARHAGRPPVGRPGGCSDREVDHAGAGEPPEPSDDGEGA